MSTFMWIITIILVTGLSEYGAYKLIKRIDRKERVRLQEWESNYIQELEQKVEDLKKKVDEIDDSYFNYNSNSN